MIYSWLKNKIPHISFIKKRKDGDMLIICSDDLSLYYFNKTAAFFIENVDNSNTIDDIKKMYLEKFDVSNVEIENDLVEIVRDLQWKQILVLEG